MRQTGLSLLFWGLRFFVFVAMNTLLLILILFAQTLPMTREIEVIASPYDEGPFLLDTLTLDPLSGFESNPVLGGAFLINYGNLSSLSIRGVPTSETQILLEGVPLNLPQSGYFDLNLLPPALPGRLEVVRGGTSSLISSGSIGGAVNIKLFHPHAFKIIAGSFGRLGGLISGTLKSSPSIGYSISMLKAENDYRYRLDNGAQGRRDNNSLMRAGIFLSLTSRKTRTLLLFSKLKAGVPGPIGSTIRGVREEYFLNIQTNYNLGPGILSVSLLRDSMFYKDYEESYHINTSIMAGFITKWMDLELIGERVNSTSTGIKSRLRGELGFLLKREPMQTVTKLVLSGDKAIITGYTGLIKRLEGRGKAFLSFHLSYREPTFNELYWKEDAFARGNPYLRPVSGEEVNFGYQFNSPFQFQLGIFRKWVKDEIVWSPDGEKWTPHNEEHVDYFGIEISFRSKLLGGSINFMRAVNRYGNPLPYLPNFSASFYVGTNSLRLETTYIGERPERQSGTKKMDDVLLLNGFVKRKFGPIELDIALLNLLNKNYCIVRGYPLPGREIRIGVTVFKKEVMN